MPFHTRILTIWPILIALIIGFLSYWTIDNYFANTLGRVIVEGKFPMGSVLVVRAKTSFGRVLEEEINLGDRPLRDVKRAGSTRLNWPVSELELELRAPLRQVKRGKDTINLYYVQFEMPFAESRTVSKTQLQQAFPSANYYGGEHAFIKLDRTDGNALLRLQEPLPKAHYFWLVWPGVFIAFLSWLLARALRISNLPAFSDMSLGRKISSQHEFNTVNGIRGLAALLVLFSHTAPGFGANNVGIALLFVISGFLLSKPFVLDCARIFNWNNVESYLLKRVKRILPMYYMFIFLSFGLSYEFDTALRNVLFVEATGHLWPMTQIFTFYMCLPIVLLLTSFLWRLNRYLPILVLLLLACGWLIFMTDWKPYYNGRYFKEFYLYAFLLGVAGAYLYFDVLKSFSATAIQSRLISVLLLLVTVLTIAWSAPIPAPQWIQSFISQFYAKCLLSMIIIILALSAQGTLINRILANPMFRSIGVIGFSFYLLHGLGIEIAQQFQIHFYGFESPDERSWSLMLLALLFTYLMSLFTYSYIERPFFGFKEKAR